MSAPEPDCADGAPHPRFAARVIGFEAAEQAVLSSLAAGRLHHAWLIAGPAGVGKATLAWQIARHLLTRPADKALTERLVPDDEHPVAARIAALSQPGLHLLRRPVDERKGTAKTVITVDEVRALKAGFALSIPDGGWRVVIVDSADDMNTNAANALLKLLEEPPPRAIFLLVSHAPSRLLPTIRSRCRMLTCLPHHPDRLAQILRHLPLDPPMDDDEIEAIAPLAEGSVGAAVRMHIHDGAALQTRIAQILGTMPGLDRHAALRFAAEMGARGQEQRRDLALTLTERMIARLARHGATGVEDPDLGRLSPDLRAARAWAESYAELPGRIRAGLATNVDPQGLFYDLMLRLDEVAGAHAAR